MTTQHTIEVHHEPPNLNPARFVLAYNHNVQGWVTANSDYARSAWFTQFTAWYDPQIGEPVKPRRYVVGATGETWAVYKMPSRECVACYIPTRSAAEAIADIYERAAEGGEA